jgi:putative PIN family toxin of toxin-antitoxin system
VLSAILDTNVLLQAALSPRGGSLKVVSAYLEGQFQLIFSAETLEELQEVLLLPAIQARHLWSEADVIDFVTMLAADAPIYVVQKTVSAKLTRDLSDTKFLSLAAESGADYLVTNDRRHLLRLNRYGSTLIVTPTKFLAALRKP